MKEQVNHPKHYNSHPNGIECIDIIRHYTCDIANAIKYLWRAGLKVPSKREQYQTRLSIAECEEARPIGQTEMDKAAIEREKSDAGIGSSERELTRLKIKEDAEKEIEDLKKALWYIEDYRKKIPQLLLRHFKSRQRMEQIVIEVTGHRIDEIWGDYEPNVATAIGHLLVVGIIRQGEVRVSELWELDIREAVKAIQDRILDIEMQLTNKELQSKVDVLNGN